MATSTNLLIIGGGPAGLATAQVFARTLRPWILYDSGAYRNAAEVESHTIMGYDGANPAEYRGDVRRDLKRYAPGEIREARVMSVKRLQDGGFEAMDDLGRKVVARKVVLATGVKDVVADIPGLAEQWGKRARHCLFCHGTETADSRIGFLLSREAASNAGVVGAMLTMWATIPHKKRYILTNGVDAEDEVLGLGKYRRVIEARGFEIITEPISSISPECHLVLPTSTVALDYIMCSSTIEASAHARALLTPALLGTWDLGAMGALPAVPADAEPPHMPPRFGADPRTPVRGLFWAGNAGAPHANVAISSAQGQIAGIVVADEIAREDLEKEAAGV